MNNEGKIGKSLWLPPCVALFSSQHLALRSELSLGPVEIDLGAEKLSDPS